MKRTFSFREARELLEWHRRILRERKELEGQRNRAEGQVRLAVNRYVKKEVHAALDNIPVEELKRSGRSFRLKALQENGIHTYGDIQRTSTVRLESFYGISASGAREIKRIVQEAEDRSAETITLRFNTDRQTEETTAILLETGRYRKLDRLCQRAGTLLEANRLAIPNKEAELKPGTSWLRWLVSSAKKKQTTATAYEELYRLRNGTYGQELESLLQEKEALQVFRAEDAWSEFAAQPIAYFNTLEELVPEWMGRVESGSDEVLGEVLAEEIQAEPIDLTGFSGRLRKYQKRGVQYILHQKKVLLGDEMGLGKTVQAIAAMVSLRNEGATHFAVVCPASVGVNWCREIQKFSDLPVGKLLGSDREWEMRKWQESGGVAVTTYGLARHLILPEGIKLALLVVDEAHYIKNPRAQRTVQTKILCESAERLLFMTGTALENRVDEMVRLISILRPEIVGQLVRSNALAWGNDATFRTVVAPVYYRRKREDVLQELPELVESEEWCSLSKEEQRVYEEAVLEKQIHEARQVSWNVQDLSHSTVCICDFRLL